jgi:lactate dehydrogenase-like 2-hydroxyacid dehydrogenase
VKRLAFIRRAYLPVVERARQMFDVAYEDRQLPTDEALRLVRAHRADAIFFTSTFRFDAAFIDALPGSVKVAASASSFLDHADVAAARARGLVLTYAPDIATGCVADLAFGLAIGAARGFGRHARTMREQSWVTRTMGEGLGTRLWGKTMGVIGFGRIGRAFAHRARGFGMHVVYHDLRRAADQIEHGAVFHPDLRSMLPLCDFVSLHTPLNAATRHILDRERLSLLPRGAIVVNSARGGLVDEAALIELLESGHLGGAGLDVFEREPDFNPKLAELDTVFLTPHVNSATRETRLALGYACLEDIAAVLDGRAPLRPAGEGIDHLTLRRRLSPLPR